MNLEAEEMSGVWGKPEKYMATALTEIHSLGYSRDE